MGQNYTHIIISCLTCLDAGESNVFGSESDLQDEDGIIVGVHYIEKVRVKFLVVDQTGIDQQRSCYDWKRFQSELYC